MKRILRKNQIVITTLAVMLAVAGYLNYSGRILEKQSEEEYDDIFTIEDDGIYVDSDSALVDPDTLTEQPDGSTVGEAVLANSTSTDTSAGSSILAAARLNREQIRARNKEELETIINSEEFTDDEKQTAITTMSEISKISQMEAEAELLLQAQGFEECVVSISENSADVIICQDEVSDTQRAQIEEIMKRKTDIPPENLVITPQNQVPVSE